MIELDTDTHFAATLQLRHVATIQPGARGARLGCEFLSLSPASQRYLQMYINQTQKRRRFLTLD